MTHPARATFALLLAAGLFACESPSGTDAGARRDAGPRRDGGGGRVDGGGVDDAGRDAGAPPTFCPRGSASSLSLAGVDLQPVAGVPIEDGAFPGRSNMEGPVWIGDSLLITQFTNDHGRILRVGPGGAVTVARADTDCNGLAIDARGRLYVGMHGDGSVSWFPLDDLATNPTALVTEFGGARFNSPNDLALRSDGNIYFSDPTWQAPSPAPQPSPSAYRIDPDGRVTRIENLPDMPNGVTLSLDETRLFIGGTNGVRVYAVDDQGRVSGGTNVPAVSGGTDGMAMDCLGNLYVTGSDRVVVLDPELDVIGSLDANGATNAAFGGPDGQTLYVTAGGTPPRLYSAHLDVAGLPY